MKHEDKIDWMARWCAKHGVALELKGECGFGRECVGIQKDGLYPDYEWWDNSTFERQDENGDVWTPPDAYHKHECVAVLGRGEEAEAQLYDWLKWFDDNNFEPESGTQTPDPGLGAMAYALGNHLYFRMVKQ